MKRLAAVVLVTVAVAARRARRSGRRSRGREAEAVRSRAGELPPLPANIKARKRFNIAREVRLAAVRVHRRPGPERRLRRRDRARGSRASRSASRNRVTYTCVTTPAREPALTTDRVDMVIATFTYTADRDTRIDFSRAYYKATGRLLVPNNASIRLPPDIAGKTVVTTSGSIYDRWMKNCFKDTKVVVTDSFTNALLAFRDGRADALMWDDTVLLGIAVTDRNSS